MSSLHHENLLEDCYEKEYERFKTSNKLNEDMMQELLLHIASKVPLLNDNNSFNSAWVNLLLILKDSIATSKQSSKMFSWCKLDIIINLLNYKELNQFYY